MLLRFLFECFLWAGPLNREGRISNKCIAQYFPKVFKIARLAVWDVSNTFFDNIARCSKKCSNDFGITFHFRLKPYFYVHQISPSSTTDGRKDAFKVFGGKATRSCRILATTRAPLRCHSMFSLEKPPSCRNHNTDVTTEGSTYKKCEIPFNK